MNRTPMKRSMKPMTRTAFKRKPATAVAVAVAVAGILRIDAVQRKSRATKPMKSRRKPLTKIQKAARGQDCTLLLDGVCNYDPATVVLCHSNRLADGKGKGIKAPDTAACFGCAPCHAVLDGQAPRPIGMTQKYVDERFDAAVDATHTILRSQGLIP